MFNNLRDKIGYTLANLALRIATPYYRRFVGGAIEYGMRSAARDIRFNRPTPPPWEDLSLDELSDVE